MIYDPWYGQPLDDGPPFIGVAALLIGTAAAAAGALTVAAVCWATDRLWRRNRR